MVETFRFKALTLGNTSTSSLTSSPKPGTIASYLIDISCDELLADDIVIGTCLARMESRSKPRWESEGVNMIEFRWVVFLVLWTLLIGPVLNLAKQSPSQTLRAKTAPARSTLIR